MLVNPNNPNAESVARNARETALSLGLQLHILNAGTAQEIDTAFARIVEQRIGLLLLGADLSASGPADICRHEYVTLPVDGLNCADQVAQTVESPTSAGRHGTGRPLET